MSTPRNILYLLCAGRLASEAGTFGLLATVPLLAYSFRADATAIAAFLIARVIGSALLGPIGRTLFRVFRGRSGFLSVNLIRAAICLALSLLNAHCYFSALALIGVFIGLASTLFTLIFNTQLPSLVSGDALSSYVSKTTGAAAVGAVAGSGFVGVISGFFGFQFAVISVALLFLCSGVALYTIRWPRSQPEPDKRVKPRAFHVLQAMPGRKWLALAVSLSFFDALGSAAHNVGLPFLANTLMPARASLLAGIILACWAFGKFAGAISFSRFPPSEARGEGAVQWFAIGVLCMSAFYVLCFNVSEVYLAIIFALVAGIGDGVAEVAIVVRIQIESDENRLTLFQIISFAQSLGFGGGMLLASVAFSYFRPGTVVAGFHTLPILAAVLIIGLKMVQSRGARWKPRERDANVTN